MQDSCHARLFTKMKILQKPRFRHGFLRKAQVQIFETIAVLAVFFILIGIGFIFYGRIMQSNLAQERDEISQLRSIAIAQKAMFLPELQCSSENIIEDSCIDFAKLKAAETVMKEKPEYYYDFFEFSNITVLEIYPGTAQHDIYARKPEFKQRFVTNVPVTIYDPLTRMNSFGILRVETYSK